MPDSQSVAIITAAAASGYGGTRRKKRPRRPNAHGIADPRSAKLCQYEQLGHHGGRRRRAAGARGLRGQHAGATALPSTWPASAARRRRLRRSASSAASTVWADRLLVLDYMRALLGNGMSCCGASSNPCGWSSCRSSIRVACGPARANRRRGPDAQCAQDAEARCPSFAGGQRCSAWLPCYHRAAPSPMERKRRHAARGRGGTAAAPLKLRRGLPLRLRLARQHLVSMRHGPHLAEMFLLRPCSSRPTHTTATPSSRRASSTCCTATCGTTPTTVRGRQPVPADDARTRLMAPGSRTRASSSRARVSSTPSWPTVPRACCGATSAVRFPRPPGGGAAALAATRRATRAPAPGRGRHWLGGERR